MFFLFYFPRICTYDDVLEGEIKGLPTFFQVGRFTVSRGPPLLLLVLKSMKIPFNSDNRLNVPQSSMCYTFLPIPNSLPLPPPTTHLPLLPWVVERGCPQLLVPGGLWWTGEDTSQLRAPCPQLLVV